MAGTSEFPILNDGNVLIVSSTRRTWRLHSTTLRNSSGVFRQLIDQTEAKHITKRQKAEGKLVEWRFDMIPHEEDPGDTRFRSFEAVEVTARMSQALPPDNTGSEPVFNQTYDNFFRCLYNLEPEFADKTGDDGALFLLDAVTLLHAAEHLQAAPAVRMMVEGHLLRMNQTLWGHIAKRPEAWSDIGVRLRSPIILREAMLHIIGQFDLKTAGGTDIIRKNYMRSQKHGLALLQLASKKASELKALKLAVERRLLEYYPDCMSHVETADYIPGREKYATDIYLWQAVTIIRQYISSAYMQDLHHRAKDGGANFYRDIGMAGDAYLRKETLVEFRKLFSMSAKGGQRLVETVQFVKTSLRAIVADLLIDKTEGARWRKEVPPYLLCSVILDEELPWASKE